MKPKFKEHFLINANGKKEAVVLDIDTYERLLEDMADLRVIAERKNNHKYLSATQRFQRRMQER